MIADAIVDEVRDRADIVELIGEHLPLQRAGKDFKALCPFHQEKTPSFYVVPAKGFYNCFGCGESGDVFAFFIKRLGLTFPDAVRHVAVRVGVEIPESGPVRREDEEHRALYEAVAFAADLYRTRLGEEAGARARRYLTERGIGAELVERCGLGYAPDEWRALRDAAHRHGIEDEVLLAAGLIKESERAEEPYDRLRNRVVFPIAEQRGRVVAFGGRILGRSTDGAPKYLNSPETPIYRKGHVLYGLDRARAAIRREQAALVVEGYMDAIALAACGLEHVVAPLGTAMTAEQATLLARNTRRALLLYDSDAAGLRATFRSADALLRAGVHPLVVTLPAGDDPDSLVRRGGAEALRPFLDGAVDVLEHKLEILHARGYFEDSDRRRKALDGVLPTLRAAADSALRDIYVARVAERTGVRRRTLEREVEAGMGAVERRPRRGRTGSGPVPPSRATARKAVDRLAAERTLLLLLLRDADRIGKAAEALGPDDFSDPVHRELFQALVARAAALVGETDAQPPTAETLGLGGPAAERLAGLLSDPQELSQGDRIYAELVGDIRARRLFYRLDELTARMSVARTEQEEAAIYRERAEVQGALRALGSELGRLGFKLSARYRRYRAEEPPGRRQTSTAEG